MLLDEFVWRSITFLNSARFFVLVRAYDCVSAVSGAFIMLKAIHFPSFSRTMGPWCVR